MRSFCNYVVALSCAVISIASAQQPYARSVTEATRIGAPGGPVRIDLLVDSARLGGAEVELAEITLQPNAPGAPHRHGTNELLYVIQGELDHTVNGQTSRLSPGMVGIVRPGDTVTHKVVSVAPVRLLVAWAPGGEGARLLGGRGGGTRVPIVTIADDVGGLRTLREAWSAAYNAGQIAPLVDMYVAAAVRMAYDAPAQVGRDSVLAGYRRSFASRTHMPTILLTAAQIEIRGDIAIERGAYDETLTPRGQGRTLNEVGKYVSLARRGADGKWRFEWSIFNRDGR